MAKGKLEKFADMDTFSNVIQAPFDEVFIKEEALLKDHTLKGKWNELIFGNNNPIVLELGCGKGEYTVALAKKNPNKNYIGVDIKGNRIWTGAKMALDENLPNVRFIRTRIDFITSFFAPNEVSEIWVTFPDPQPRESRDTKRLTHPRFLNRYKQLLKKEGIVHLKTDSNPLYLFTQEVVENEQHILLNFTDDLYGNSNENIPSETKEVKTFYESLFLKEGKKICYISFRLK